MMFFKLAMPGMWNKVTFYTSAQAYILSCLHHSTLYYWERVLNMREEPFPFWECMLSCIWTPILTRLSIPFCLPSFVFCLFCVFVMKWLPLLWCIWTNKVLLSQATPNNCLWWGLFPSSKSFFFSFEISLMYQFKYGPLLVWPWNYHLICYFYKITIIKSCF